MPDDMNSPPPISAVSSWFHRLFLPGPHRTTLTGGTVKFEKGVGDLMAQIPVDAIDSITLDSSWFWHRLTFRQTDGVELSIGGLEESEASLFRDAALEDAARVHEAAVEKARILEPRLTELDGEIGQFLSGNRYARHNHSLRIHKSVASIVKECAGLVREKLEPEAEEALVRLEFLEPVESFEKARQSANRSFVANHTPKVRSAAGTVLSNPLTDEQAEAIATDEDVTLVLAGAGTGKTAVVVGKVAHLVRNEGVSPDEILVLAFNNKAVNEINDRLQGDLSKAHVHTFHSFGLRVIGDVEGVRPGITKEGELLGTLEDILDELLEDPKESDATAHFIATYHGAYESVFDFRTEEEYFAYVRSVELRTLSGAKVKSFEKLEIANFLTTNGVEFCYERPYEVRTETREYRQYHPDFYLPDYDIYIEHYALDENGNPPPGWTGYRERVEWHRNTHDRYGTKLVETYSWEHRRGIILDELRKRLEAQGVRFKRVSRRALVLRLARLLISWLAGLIAKFLNHVKTNGLTFHELRVRAAEQGILWRSEAFLGVFEKVRTRYERRLKSEGKIDFHDMINRAVQYIDAGRWESPYRYVVVDEFQDISAGRMDLLGALKREDTAYFLVGDDWQSINRFAGSDVSLLRNCGDYLGYVQPKTLTRTFRYGDGILRPSSDFVRRNPEQTQRPMTSSDVSIDGGITIVWSDDSTIDLRRIREDIQAYTRGGRHSLLALGRYNWSKDALKGKRPREEFSTVHKAKGREADFVVVLDLKDDRWGFPSRIEDNSLLRLAMPPVSESPYPFAEERRLFYVAMTRARIGTYLIVDEDRPSSFVTELLDQSDDLRQIGAPARQCPRCQEGRLQIIDGRHGPFWGCSEYRSIPSCRFIENIELAIEK